MLHHRTCMSGNPPRRSRTCRDGVAHKGLVSLTLRSNCRMPPPRGGAAAPCAAASAPSRAASRRAARAPSRARCARRTSRATEACTSPCPAAAAAAAACRAARRASRRPRKGWRRTWGRRARNAERTDATFFFLSLLLSPPGQEAASRVSPGRELQTTPGGHTRPERRAVRADARSVSGGERVRVERHEVRRAHVDRVDDDEREALLGDCLRERALANERTNERNERRSAAPGWDHIASDRA